MLHNPVIFFGQHPYLAFLAVLTFRYDNVASVLHRRTVAYFFLFFAAAATPLRRRRPGLRHKSGAKAAVHYRRHVSEFRINSLYFAEQADGGRFADVAAIAEYVVYLARG
jgi:hypothetical protein